jgi:hypothetical protein
MKNLNTHILILELSFYKYNQNALKKNLVHFDVSFPPKLV